MDDDRAVDWNGLAICQTQLWDGVGCWRGACGVTAALGHAAGVLGRDVARALGGRPAAGLLSRQAVSAEG